MRHMFSLVCIIFTSYFFLVTRDATLDLRREEGEVGCRWTE